MGKWHYHNHPIKTDQIRYNYGCPVKKDVFPIVFNTQILVENNHLIYFVHIFVQNYMYYIQNYVHKNKLENS